MEIEIRETFFETMESLIEEYCVSVTDGGVFPSTKGQYEYVLGRMKNIGLVNDADIEKYIDLKFGE